MKKIMLLLAVMATLTVSAQVWTPTAVTPLTSGELPYVMSYVQAGTTMYIAMNNAAGRTTVISFDGSSTDTIMGCENLPINTATLTMEPGNNNLWITGKGTGCDSVIWKKDLTSAVPALNIWGPHFRPTSAKYAWVKNVSFLGSEIYFSGRFDSLASNQWPNLVKYVGGVFSQPIQTNLVQINRLGGTNAMTPMVVAKVSRPGELMFTAPGKADSVLVITGPTTGYIQKLWRPTLSDVGSGGVSNDAIFYKGDIYYSSIDYDLTGQNLSVRIIKDHYGTAETVARIFKHSSSLDLDVSNDWDVIDNHLVMIMQATPGYSESMSGILFGTVMAFDSVSFSPVISSTIFPFNALNDGILFGQIATRADAVHGLGFYQLSFSDTSAPTISLAGPNTVIVHKGHSYVEPGFTAIDNQDGNITGSVVVSGVVNTNVVGSYTLTYTSTDAAGNTTSANRMVTVDDNNRLFTPEDMWNIIIYPNSFKINGVTNESVSVTVYTLGGQQVQMEVLPNYEYKISNPGVYAVRLKIDANEKTFKFVSQQQ